MFSNTYRKITASVILSFFLLPVFALAQTSPASDGLPKGEDVSTGQARGTFFGITYECNHLKNVTDAKGVSKDVPVPGECNFEDLVQAVLHVVNWGTGIALSFSVVVIAYAGANYMMSGDNPKKRSDANRMLQKVVIGIFFILCAWLVVKLITSALGVNTGISTLG
jgi:hypothetical protein